MTAFNLIIAGTAPRANDAPFDTTTVGNLWAILDEIQRSFVANGHSIQSVTTGVAQGVDYEAKRWAFDKGIWTNDFPANWGESGKNAGPARNRHMVSETIKRYGRDTVRWYGFTTKPLEQSRGTKSCYGFAGETFGLPTHHFRLDLLEWEF